MAALSESDRRKILGDRYQELEDQSAPAIETRRTQQFKENVENQKFTATAGMVMAVGLFISAYYTATGMVAVIQNGIAAALLLLCLVWYVYARQKQARMVAGRPPGA